MTTEQHATAADAFAAVLQRAKDYGMPHLKLPIDAADQVLAALRQSSGTCATCQWQPMETAPKDGTKVWLAYRAYQGRMMVLPGKFDAKGRWWTDVGDVPAEQWQPYRIPSPPVHQERQS